MLATRDCTQLALLPPYSSMKGKKRRYGRFEGYTSDWKKAVVTLTAESKTIDFFNGMF